MSNNSSLTFEPEPEDARAMAYRLFEAVDLHSGDGSLKVTIETNGDSHVEGNFRLGLDGPIIL